MQLARTTLITRTFTPSTAIAAVASGSSAADGLAGASVDMANFEGVLFIQGVVGGGTGGNVSFAVRQSTAAISASSGGQGTALSGSTSTVAAGSSATGETFVIDVYKPRSFGGARHLFGQITVASSCAVLGQQYAIQYAPRVAPQSTSAGNSTASQNGITGGVVAAVSPSS